MEIGRNGFVGWNGKRVLCARPKERDREDGWTERERERRSSGKGKESERTAAGRGKLAPSRLANIFFFSLSPSPRFHEG